jgi:NADH dehydrogenase
MKRKRILILGGGYGGLAVMRGLAGRLRRSHYSICLIDESPFHTIKTRFHELAVYRNRGRFIRFPIRIFTRSAGAEFVQARAQSIRFSRRFVTTSRGDYPYDILVVTLGGATNYFGVRGAKANTVNLQTYEAAVECSHRIGQLGLVDDRGPSRRVIICGAGIEGIEVAAMLRQYAGPNRCEVLIIEKNDEIMARSQCRDRQKEYMYEYFRKNGIQLRLASAIRQVGKRGVFLESGEKIESDLVVWCSGVSRAPVTGIPKKRAFEVSESLQGKKHPEVLSIGDFATVDSRARWSNLLSAQRALYQADLVAENVVRLEQGRQGKPEDYTPKGELIGLGDFDGVGIVGGIPVKGKAAALAKKANEAKYLRDLFQDVPRSLLRAVRRS